VAMEVMVAVQSGTLLHALRVPLKRRVSARRGGFLLFFMPATDCKYYLKIMVYSCFYRDFHFELWRKGEPCR